MRRFLIVISIVLIGLFSCSKEKEEITHEFEGGLIMIPDDAVTLPSGLKYVDVVEGSGDSPEQGQQVAVHYTGKLMNGKKFDSSYDRNTTLDFKAGVGQMIPGFDEGVMTMKEGGQRILYIPYQLAYGEQGIPGAIPPKSDLVFEVELVEIR